MPQVFSIPAFLLGVVFRELFPEDPYLGSGVDQLGFYAQIKRREPLEESFLPLLENKMKELLSKEITFMEMLNTNAAEFFEHHNEPELAKDARQNPGILHIATLGDHSDIVWGECDDFEEFRLFDLDHATVSGWAFRTPMERQAFDKRLRAFQKIKTDHLVSHERGEWIWHPKGMDAKSLFKKKHKEFLERFGIFEVKISPQNAKDYCKEKGLAGLYFWEEIPPNSRDLFKGPSERDCIYLNDPAVWDEVMKIFETKLIDPLGRPWPGPKREGRWATLFPSLGRAIFLNCI